MSGLYGGEALAQKAASLELKGLRSYLEFIDAENEHRLHVPLMILIDYWGYRVIATSVLPIGSGTLCYGSSDAGATVHNESPELNAIMERAARFIGMKGHVVGFTQPKLIHGPCDIEGHLGRDGKYYVLDTARLYCPESPSRFFMALRLPADAFRRSSV